MIFFIIYFYETEELVKLPGSLLLLPRNQAKYTLKQTFFRKIWMTTLGPTNINPNTNRYWWMRPKWAFLKVSASLFTTIRTLRSALDTTTPKIFTKKCIIPLLGNKHVPSRMMLCRYYPLSIMKLIAVRRILTQKSLRSRVVKPKISNRVLLAPDPILIIPLKLAV